MRKVGVTVRGCGVSWSDGAQLPASGSSSEQVSVVEVDEAHDEVL